MTSRPTTLTAAIAVAAVAALAATVAAAPADAVTPTPAPTASSSTLATPTPTPTLPTSVPTAAPTRRPAPPAPTASAVTPTPIPTPPVLVPTPPALTPTPTPTPIVPLPVVSSINKHVGHTALSRTATITGSRFTNLAGVQVAGTPVTSLRVLSPTRATFVLPNAYDYQPKTAQITVTAWSDRTPRRTGLTFQYKADSRLDKQMAYAFRNWNASSNRTFGYLSGNDCANFASQTLLARGWARSPQWFNYGPGRWSGSWVSSTALSTWLKSRPDLATRLVYSQRDQVAVGDIVQFRWPGHKKSYSAWEHTAVVSKVVVLPNGRHDVYYVAHTLNRQYGGGTTGLAAWYAKQKIKGSTLRIQFFHLLK